MIVAIHQPNYAPWLGYFAKMARADVLIYLDDAQYSKNSYINRVQIDAGGRARWLTVPVSYRFGKSIDAVRMCDPNWRRSHLDTLKMFYSLAPHFTEIWPWLSALYEKMSTENLALSNRAIIEGVSSRLGLNVAFRSSRELDASTLRGDDRLIDLVKRVGGRMYLSGKGGSSYQDPTKFTAAGIELAYSRFEHPTYDQGHDLFLPGLSVLDALFRLGFAQTSELVKPKSGSA